MAKAPNRYWITVADAAAILDLDPATVRGWAKRALTGRPTRLRKARFHCAAYFVSRNEIRKLYKRTFLYNQNTL